LKTTKTSISIFAENKITYDYLASQNLFSASLINRTNPKESSQLVFFDLPPNREIVDDLIKKTSAKVVHLLKNNSLEINIVDLLKNLSGMLKYADSKLSGEINLETLASKLCVSRDVVEIVLKLFNAAEIIEIIDMTDEQVFKIKFIQGKDFSSLKEHAEYEELILALNEINEFRNTFEFA
jgi:hypothetical protein